MEPLGVSDRSKKEQFKPLGDSDRNQKDLFILLGDSDRYQKGLFTSLGDSDDRKKELLEPFGDSDRFKKEHFAPLGDSERSEKERFGPFGDSERSKKKQFAPLGDADYGAAARDSSRYVLSNPQNPKTPMSNFFYEAVDAGGLKMEGSLDVASQSEAVRRVKEMGLFPTKIAEARERRRKEKAARTALAKKDRATGAWLMRRSVKPAVLAVFTRQLATLIDAGMPLLRGLRILREQETNPTLKRVLGHIENSIEGGAGLSEAMSAHPRVFSLLYLNMVRAGEISGSLESTLGRLADFMEKAQKIRGKIKAAMFYPSSVMFVAMSILALLLVYVVPRFQEVLSGLGVPMPAFTTFIINLSGLVRHHFLQSATVLAALAAILFLASRTVRGRVYFDMFKLKCPVLGPVFRKVAVSRFARTLGTLLGNGVPILQALSIVKDTTGNVIISNVVSAVHDNVKQGESIATPLRESHVFPAIVAGMVDIGEQTGALPDMLMKVADNYDAQVDNAVTAMTSLLEPIMIVFLAVIVGSIVIAMFLPIIIATGGFGGDNPGGGNL